MKTATRSGTEFPVRLQLNGRICNCLTDGGDYAGIKARKLSYE
ncbi:MAG: hypothetical protein ABI763_08635 [Bacteroidota bacterium]